MPSALIAFGGKKGSARDAKAQGFLINFVRRGCRDTLRRVSDENIVRVSDQTKIVSFYWKNIL
jgi:hypothetical protein